MNDVKITGKIASPAQCRAARALLNWTQAALAERAGVARKTVADFEIGERILHVRTRRDIMMTLEAAGIEFVWGDAAGSEGDGVRFSKAVSRPKISRPKMM